MPTREVPTMTTGQRERARAAMTALLASRGAGRIAHGFWSLLRHLTATYELLVHWDQPAHVVLAGLVHSVYSTDAFAARLFAWDERDRVREHVGAPAERLAALFCQTDRVELFGALDRGAMATSSVPLRVRGRLDGASIAIDAAELGSLAVLHVANLAEQGRMNDGVPGLWLADAHRILTAATPLIASVPPIFERCLLAPTAAAEQALTDAYVTLWEPRRGRFRGSIGAARKVIESTAWVGEPFLALGFDALARENPLPVADDARRALALLTQWGTAWDKRLAFAEWLELAAFLEACAGLGPADRGFVGQRLRAAFPASCPPPLLAAFVRGVGNSGALETANAAAPAWAISRAAEGPVSAQSAAPVQAETALGEDPRAEPSALLPPRFAAYIAGLGENREQPLMVRYPELRARPWHEPARFALASNLEADAANVRREILALDVDAFHAESESIERTGNWDVRMLIERGRVAAGARASCPLTTALLERHGAIRGLAGLAYVSRLRAGTSVAAHRGPTNLRLRCHLGIDIPPGCGIEVAGETRGWTAGRCLVFDDSFEHRVWNEGEHDRIVLIVDMWHPDLTVREIELLEGLHRYTQTHAENLAGYWTRNEHARTSAGGSNEPRMPLD